MGRVNSSTERWLPTLVAFSMLVALFVFTSPVPADAAISPDDFEQCLLDKANQARANAGVGQLQMAHDLVPDVRDWSRDMRYDTFEHMPGSLRQSILPDAWTTWGENIAMHGYSNMADCDAIHQMWMNSEGHRRNILNPDFRFLAVGAYVDGSGWWATQLFFNCNGTFCDDDGVFESSIERIAAAGITEGCNPPTNNLFCPGDRVTRGAMAAFLARALDGLTTSSNIDFSDDNGHVFESAIERIAAAGITEGCNPPSNTRFCPDSYVTRGQMAAFLARALSLPGANSVDFTDDNGHVFESAIESIAAAGITQGCNPPSNTRFCPNDYVTRGQMAAFLSRALDL